MRFSARITGTHSIDLDLPCHVPLDLKGTISDMMMDATLHTLRNGVCGIYVGLTLSYHHRQCQQTHELQSIETYSELARIASSR